MRQAGGVDQVGVAAERRAELPADLRALQRVGEPGAREVARARPRPPGSWRPAGAARRCAAPGPGPARTGPRRRLGSSPAPRPACGRLGRPAGRSAWRVVAAGAARVTCCRCHPAVSQRPRRGRPPAGRPGPGTASRTRSSGPTSWKKWTESGSPPCSPQTPSFRSGPGGPALLGGDRDQPADAARCRWSRTGRRRRCPARCTRLKNAPSTSSREKPQVIWVRSLVPKEKNSADLAISPAIIAARGTSIIVPIRVCTSDAGLLLDLGQHLAPSPPG